MQDFTLIRYRTLLESLVSCNFHPISLGTFFSQKSPKEKPLLLRHDVDRKPGRALLVAALEHDLGISSSYYFRYPSTFDKKTIPIIESLGHEIGYHYEVMVKARGNLEKAGKLFDHELKEFRKICDVRTCCAHGSPLSSFDNRFFFSQRQIADYNLIGDAHLSIPDDIPYFTDTGRSWGMQANIRDRLTSSRGVINLQGTDDLENHIVHSEYSRLYLVTHPERWTNPGFSWYTQYCKDRIFNLGKKILVMVR